MTTARETGELQPVHTNGGIVYYPKTDRDRRIDQTTAALENDLTVRAARHLRHVCEIYRIDPPTIGEIHEYASVAFDVLEDDTNLNDWLIDYIDDREQVAGDRCQSIFRRLDTYARLDTETAQAIADTSETARFASSCDPCVLVLTTSSGGAIVADISGGAVHEYDPQPRRRTPLAYIAGLFRGR
jgi:hypothetical protein